MRIRRASVSDIRALVALENECFTMYRLSARQFGRFRESRRAVVLVAEDRGEVLGDAVGLVRRYRNVVGGRIYSVVVGKRHRGRGIGRRLVRAILAELAGRGANRISLEVEAPNRAAIRLYEQFGFQRATALPDYYGKGRPGLRMIRYLKASRK
jgi:ribosomal protein S18 acetylase RimI-like enzyme